MAKKTTRSGSGCLILFALPFAGVGVFMFGLTVWTLVDWWRMQGWVEVPAQILEARLEEHHDDDSTTYRAVARYTYVYEGRQYQGSRVAIDTTADNLGSFHQRKVAELEARMSRNEPAPCFVDAADPERSVLFRELRFEVLAFYLLFVVVFGGAGGGLLVFSIYAMRQARRSTSLEQKHPEQPWMWRPDWSEGNVRSSNKTAMRAAVGFAVLWNLITSPVWFFLPGEVRQGNYLALLGLMFPVVGLGLAVWAVVAVRRWMKYGESIFQLASVPGVVGGPLAGVIHTSVNLRPEKGFRQTLTCLRKVTTGSGDNRRTREDVLWQTSRTMQQELAPDDTTRSAIPVQFHIPYEAEPTTPPGDGSPVLWRLEVAADAPGLDYQATFEVPVFRTADSSPDYRPDETAIAPYARPENTADAYAAHGVVRRETIKGLNIEFPLFRNLGTACGLTVFLLIWTGAIVLMVYLGAPLLFPILFGLFELLILYFALDVWLWSSALQVGADGATLRAGLVGLAATRTFSKHDIRSVAYKTGMQSGGTMFFDLQLVTQDGKEYVFGKRVPSQVAAAAIAADVRRVLGLEEPVDNEDEDEDDQHE